MADRYRFQWKHFDGVLEYSLFEDDIEVVTNIPAPGDGEDLTPEFDLMFDGIERGIHLYRVVGYNETSSVKSPILTIDHQPLVGEIQDFRYSVA